MKNNSLPFGEYVKQRREQLGKTMRAFAAEVEIAVCGFAVVPQRLQQTQQRNGVGSATQGYDYFVRWHKKPFLIDVLCYSFLFHGGKYTCFL